MSAVFSGPPGVAVNRYDERDQWNFRDWSSTSWGAIIAGVACAIGVQFVLTLLGVAIGISSTGPVDEPNTAAVETIGMGAAIWWLVSGTLSIAVGGMVLGRLSRFGRGCSLHLNALAMWSVIAIFGFGVIWSGMGMASDAASPLATLAVREAPTQEQLIAMTTTPVDGAAGSGRSVEVNREQLAATARAHAESTREAAATAAWWAFIAMLAGIGAALGGAYVTAQPVDRRVTHVDALGTPAHA